MLREYTNRTQLAAGEDGFTFSYTADGYVDQVIAPQGWLVDYEYASSRLVSISLYDGPTDSDTLLQRVEYVYHDGGVTHGPDLGTHGDLLQVKVNKRASHDSGSTLSITRTTQYRYHGSGDNDHQIKLVFEPDAIERIVADYSGLADADDILAVADDYDTGSANSAEVKDFASRSFTHYDRSQINDTDGGEIVPGLDTTENATTSWGTENLNSKYGGYDFAEWD